eukprot:GFUD01041908.1.p1 GENE.GFUD01041908.1~~GFUD01041908.1.p1  ORF type:complete len:319 (+),score=86.46 GFUD01041908.1:69-1025(+)
MLPVQGTVCCILCRGVLGYKEKDSARFESHMQSEHGAYFDLEFVLAACLMDEEEKTAVKTVMTAKYDEALEEAKEDEVEVDEEEDKLNVISDDQIKVEDYGKEVSISLEESIPKAVENFTCSKCDATFASVKYVKKHESIVHSVNKELFPCNKCRKSYAWKSTLLKHKRRDHCENSPDDITNTEHHEENVAVLMKAAVDNTTVSDKYYVDISRSNYFLNLPMVIKPLKSRIYRKDFKEKDDKLPSGWRFKIREQNNPQYTGGIRKNKVFLTPDNRTVHTGLGVIEYLRLEEKFGQEELWILAQHLGIERKKFQRLWTS